MNVKMFCLTTLALVVLGIICDADAFWGSGSRGPFNPRPGSPGPFNPSPPGFPGPWNPRPGPYLLKRSVVDTGDGGPDNVDRMRQHLSDGDVITMTKVRELVDELHDGEGLTADQITNFLQTHLKMEVSGNDAHEKPEIDKRSITIEKIRELEQETDNMHK